MAKTYVPPSDVKILVEDLTIFDAAKIVEFLEYEEIRCTLTSMEKTDEQED